MIGNSKFVDISVNGQILDYTEYNDVIEGSVGYLQCRLKFTDDWNNSAKKARFFGADYPGTAEKPVKPIDVLVTKGTDSAPDGRPYWYCLVPYEIIKVPHFRVTLFYEGSETITTNTLTVNVKPTDYIAGEGVPPETQPPGPEFESVFTPAGSKSRLIDVTPDGVGLYSENGGKYSEFAAREIVPIDITGKTVDLDEFNPLNGYNGVHWWICRNGAQAAGIAHRPMDIALAFDVTFKAQTDSAGVASGVMELQASNSTGGRYIFRRWYNSGATPRWSRWVIADNRSLNLYVNGATGNDTESEYGLTSAKPLKTLTAALNDINAYYYEKFVTINLAGGEYEITSLPQSLNVVFNGNASETERSVVNYSSAAAVYNSPIMVKLVNTDFKAENTSYFRFQSGEIYFDRSRVTARALTFMNCTVRAANASSGITIEFNQASAYPEGANITLLDGAAMYDGGTAEYNGSTIGAISNAAGVFSRPTAFKGTSKPRVSNPRNSLGYYAGGVRWTSGNYTGVNNEFVFAKITQTGAFRITARGTGNYNISIYSWELYNGYNNISAKLMGKAIDGTLETITLQYSKLTANSYLIKVIANNPNIGANTNNIAVTITPLHATDNDGFVTLSGQGESLTDTPSTWVTI